MRADSHATPARVTHNDLFEIGKGGANFVKTRALRNEACLAACERFVVALRSTARLR